MPKPSSTFRNVSRSHLAVTRPSHVWISEDVLSETFNAFAQNHKRYGSHVPGPLEARRRASKRRATHLAHHVPTGYSLDPFGLFDTRTENEWWKKAEPASQPRASPGLWSFVFPRVAQRPPPPPVPTIADKRIPGIPPSTSARSNLKLAEKEIQLLLHHVRTHTDLMEKLPNIATDLRHNPRLGHVLLKHMLVQHWEHKEVAEFLLDPWTNPPGNANHIYIVKHAMSSSDLISWLFLHNVFPRAIRLGLLDVVEIQKLLLSLPNIPLPEIWKNTTWASISTQLLTAIERSEVLTTKDLDKSFLSGWIESISSCTFCTNVPSLLWRLYQLLGVPENEALSDVVHISLSMAKKDTISHLSSLVDLLRSQPHNLVAPILFTLTQRLLDEAGLERFDRLSNSNMRLHVDNQLRTDLLQQIRGVFDNGANKTVKYHRRARNGRRGALLEEGEAAERDLIPQMVQCRLLKVTKLELWYAVLGNLESMQHFEGDEYDLALRDFVQVQRKERDTQRSLLVAAWVATALSVQGDTFINSSGISKALSTELQRTILSATAAREDFLGRFLTILKPLPLPAKNKLLRRISKLSDGLIAVRQNYWDMVQVHDHLNDARILEIGNVVMYPSMKQHFPAKLREMCEGFNPDMEMFEKSCIDIIRYARGSIGIVFNVLENNQRLQESLVRAALELTSRQRHRDLRVSPDVLGGRSPIQILEMIERFAHEIAKSEQLSSRSAFDKIYWLMQYLVRMRIPIRSAIWKAMWHARVVRQDEAGNGTSYYTVKWLYEKIKKTDGEAEADRLLRVSSMSKRLTKSDIKSLPEAIPRESRSHSDGVLAITGGHEGDDVNVLPFDNSGLKKTSQQTPVRPRRFTERRTNMKSDAGHIPGGEIRDSGYR